MKTLLRSRLLVGTTFLSLGGTITYACKDFLNTPPQGALDEAALVSRSGVEGSLIAAYRVLDCTSETAAWGCAASNWVFGSITSDDAYKGSEDTDQPGATQIELYDWQGGQAEEYLDAKWATAYEGVVRSNATLRLLERVLTEKPGLISAADANGIRGEALFLRAHYHFEAWRMWGRIPYYFESDSTPAASGGFRKANDLTPDSVAQLIIADLNTAIALLPASPRNGQAGRASAWTARAYKGRVQAYTAQWDSALVTLGAVRASGEYGLERSFDRVWTGFQEFANGPETIFAYQASANDGEPNGQNANWGETLNFPHGGSPFGCCGFHQPSQNLVNFYAVDGATGLPKAFTNPAVWNSRDSNLVASVTDTLDPRLDWTVGRDGVPYKDWGLHDGSVTGKWIRSPGYGGPYSPKKNAHERASGAQSQVGWNSAQLNSVHIHLYRYADLLLLLAEAEIEAAAGSIVRAQAIVNQIRARADSAAQGCGAGTNAVLVAKYPACDGDNRIAVPTNDPSIGWATYRVSQYTTPWPDAATARTAVRIERRLELAMEGQRFFDLRRWGFSVAQPTIAAYLAEENTRRTYKTAQVAFAERHMYYPIPQVEIILSRVGGQDRLVQTHPDW